MGGKANRKKGSHGLQNFLSPFHENMKTQGNFTSVILHHRADYGTMQHEAASPSQHWGSISVDLKSTGINLGPELNEMGLMHADL